MISDGNLISMEYHYTRDVNKAAKPRSRPCIYKTKAMLPMPRPIVQPNVGIKV